MGLSTQGSPMVFNLCDRSKALNGNMIALGTSGSRKSTLDKLLILGNIMNPKNQQTIVVDLENEYVQLARNFNQQVIEFTRNADINSPTINIFQIPKLDT
jgi:type IV secretory pathway VirB4 component